MAAFSLTCTTCRARLRVRDDSAIGQILACPKCGSMVLVQAPEHVAAPEPEVKTAPQADPAPLVQTSAPAVGRKPRFREDFPLADAPADDAVPGTDPAPQQGPAAVYVAALPEATEYPLREEWWLVRYQQWWWIGGAAMVGIALAFIVVGFLIARTGSPPSSVACGERSTEPSARPDASSATNGSSPDLTPDTLQPDLVPSPPSDSTGPSAAGSPTGEESSLSVPPTADGGHDAVPGSPHTEPPVDADPLEETETASTAPEDRQEPAEATGLTDQLSMVIPAVEFAGVPIADFARFVSDLAAMPVTLDLDAMLVAGLAAETALDAHLRDVTVDQFLRAVLEPHQLHYRLLAGHIIIAPAPRGESDWVRETYEVSDLAADDDQLALLASQIKTLIAPRTWEGERVGNDAAQTGLLPGGRLTMIEQSLEIEQTAEVHFHVRRLLDRLRSARGLLTRSDLPAALTDVTPVFAQAAEEFNQPVTLILAEPTELARIFDSLHAQNGLYWVADWRELEPLGWTPTTPRTVSFDTQPLGHALADWLREASLDYRLVDARTVQISSQTAIMARQEVEVYPLREAAVRDTQSIIGAARQYIGEEFFDGKQGAGAILVDPHVPGLLVALPQPQQRRLAEYLSVQKHLRRPEGPE